MKTMRGSMKTAGMAAAVMLVAASAVAQSAPRVMAQEDAAAQALATTMQAQVQAKIQAQVLAKMQAQADTWVNSREQAAMQADALRLQAESLAQIGPLEAKLEMNMAPMQAEMLADSVRLQAESAVVIARGAMMQAEMENVGDPQVKDDLFAGTEKFAQGATNVTDVNLGPDMLGMVSGQHGGNIAHKLNFMVVRTYEYPRAGMYKLEDVDAYRQKLRTGNWNCFIHTHESATGESTDICNRALPNNEGSEMVILTVEPKELTFIHMSGKGSLADLGKLGALGNLGNLGALGNLGGQQAPEPPEPPTKPAPHE
jgi:hypothetical protein